MDQDLPDALFEIPGKDADGAVVVALSGGLDSTVLLHRLAMVAPIRRRGLRALHVHHGLLPDADAWADHCVSACAALDVPLDIHEVDVDRGSGLGLEAAARMARHAAFEDALEAGGVIALAHHRDDQAETFLMRALRGSGPEGLAAMRPWRRCGRGWMWRPLLGQPRARLEAWARAHGLAWIEDPSNADPAHARSFLRTTLLPLLRQRWPKADAALARSATLAAEAADLLAAEDDTLLRRLDGARAPGTPAASRDDADGESPGTPGEPRGPALPVAALRGLEPAARARLLRAWIHRQGLPPLPGAGVDAIVRLLDARHDGDATYRWGDACVRAWRGCIHALPLAAMTPLPVDWERPWDGVAPLDLPTGGRLWLEDARGFDQPLRVHARRGGEHLRLPGREHSHALKHLLQDAGIPPWQRARLPLLSDADGDLLAAGDRVVAGPLHAWLAARRARLHWRDMA